jgi:transposase
MSKRFRSCSLDQPFLLPPNLQDWLPEAHLARFVADVTNELDLSAIYAEYERKDGRGLAAYHPLLLVRLLLYGYCVGIFSSRRIEQATHDQIAFRYLAADQHPDHDTIANFRQQHLENLGKLFLQALRLCHKAGLVKLGHVAIDGTKIMANASTHRSVSYERLLEKERYWEEKVGSLLGAAGEMDRQEDELFGKGQPADPLPEELANAQQRLERIKQAKQELEEEAQQQLKQAMAEHTPKPRGRPKKHDGSGEPVSPASRDKRKKKWYRARKNAESPGRQYNFTDPDSRVMHDNGRKAFVQSYNAQLAVDGKAQVIVAADITQQVIDREQLLPMVKLIQETMGCLPEAITADAGYWDTESLLHESVTAVNLLVSPDSKPIPPGEQPSSMRRNPLAQRMRERLASESGHAIYRLRKAIVEPVFGHIKERRPFRRFSFRSLIKVRAEWNLICLTHNLLKLFRQQGLAQPA